MNVFSVDKQKSQLGYISLGTFFPCMFLYLILNNMQKNIKIKYTNWTILCTNTIISTPNFITCWYLWLLVVNKKWWVVQVSNGKNCPLLTITQANKSWNWVCDW